MQVFVCGDPLEEALRQQTEVESFEELVGLKLLDLDAWPHAQLPERMEEMLHLQPLGL